MSLEVAIEGKLFVKSDTDAHVEGCGNFGLA
jgi:hypothetical protein